MPAWSAYHFDVLDDDGRRRIHASPLETLYHIVHVPEAEEILRRECISSHPVYDESKLNSTRTHVVWLSPNHWSAGSFYGNVRFSFDWASLIAGCKLYWVESITKYSPHAPRLLVSPKGVDELGGAAMVTPYDPVRHDGPILETDEGWFWNNEVTLEVMVDRDVVLDECNRLEIVQHHRATCRGRHPKCLYKGEVVSKPGSEFLAYVVGSGTHSIDEAWTPNIGLPDGSRYHSDLVYSVMGLQERLRGRCPTLTGPVVSEIEARSVIKAACLQVAQGNDAEAGKLVGLLGSESLFKSALTRTLRKHFGLREIRLIE